MSPAVVVVGVKYRHHGLVGRELLGSSIRCPGGINPPKNHLVCLPSGSLINLEKTVYVIVRVWSCNATFEGRPDFLLTLTA